MISLKRLRWLEQRYDGPIPDHELIDDPRALARVRLSGAIFELERLHAERRRTLAEIQSGEHPHLHGQIDLYRREVQYYRRALRGLYRRFAVLCGWFEETRRSVP